MFKYCERIIKHINFPIKLVKVTSVKPLDLELIHSLFTSSKQKIVVTMEEGIKTGGFGQNLINYLQDNFNNQIERTKILGFDNFIPHGKREDLLKDAGMNTNGILAILNEEVQKITQNHKIIL